MCVCEQYSRAGYFLQTSMMADWEMSESLLTIFILTRLKVDTMVKSARPEDIQHQLLSALF